MNSSEERNNQYKAILNGMREELLGEAEKTVIDMSGAEKENFPDPTDRAALETDRNFLLRVKDRERKLISKVDEALKRIDDGSFGTCELCGEFISAKRLEVRPVATCCIECKTEEEEHEKGRGSV